MKNGLKANSQFFIRTSKFEIHRSQIHRAPREITISSSVSRYSPGVNRIAAPVGHDRTHAGPPEISRHRSHFTATVCSASSFAFLNSDATHVNKFRGGVLCTMKMLP